MENRFIIADNAPDWYIDFVLGILDSTHKLITRKSKKIFKDLKL